MRRLRGNRNGQILVGVILLLLLLLITIPAVVTYIQNESRWALKEQRTTRAFQLAEMAVESGYQQLIISTTTWTNVIAGTIPSGYNFDKAYTDKGGQYEIRLSAVGTQQVAVTGVGEDTSTRELRAIKAVYSNASTGNNAISAGNAVSVGASCNVEWGSITSYTSIDPGGRTYPRLYSTGNIVGFDLNGSAPPNTDNIQWWSYDTRLPAQPQLDVQFYLSSATNAGATATYGASGCPTNYYNTGNVTFKGCTDTSGHTYYITGDATFNAGSGGNFIAGNVVALGNINVSGNGGSDNASGSYTATIPPQAWEEYGNAWSTYKGYDSYANSHYATYQDAVNANYTASNITAALSGVLIHGLAYSGGNQGLTGGGNGRFHGVLLTPGSSTISTSSFTLYFDNNIATMLKTKFLSLARQSWQDWTGCDWTGTNPTCP